jgi:DnaJ-class molecular chaperone
MEGMIRINVGGTEVQIDPAVEQFATEKVKFVFVKDAETGQSVRVVEKSKAMVEYIQMISVDHGHSYWAIPACSSCDGDGCVEYVGLNHKMQTRPCPQCFGYGVEPKCAA